MPLFSVDILLTVIIPTGILLITSYNTLDAV